MAIVGFENKAAGNRRGTVAASFRIDCRRRVIEAVDVAVIQHTPFDARDGGITQYLPDPSTVTKIAGEALGFNEQLEIVSDGKD